MDADVVRRVTRLLAQPEHGDRLEIALLGRRHMAGDPAAGEELEHRHAEALKQAGSGCQLRLATLAETYTRLPGGVPVAAQLVATALAVPLGDAAMTGLTLAEAVSIVAPSDTESIRLALDAAEAAAHAVADPARRARTVAWVTEMLSRWGPAPPDPDEAIAALLRDAAPSPTRAPDPDAPGTDPGLRAVIAARLAAAVVVDFGPPGPRLAARLRRLVPVAAADPAAHCTVLTRLLLATPAEEVRSLEKIPTIERHARHDRGQQ
jgi:hypothetical protein